jgi:hypothetical protein
MVQTCLNELGAGADAAEMINELARQRKEKKNEAIGALMPRNAGEAKDRDFRFEDGEVKVIGDEPDK